MGANAPGKAPFSWPNSSLSMMFAAIALQSSEISGALARRLAAWIARATVSLPVPGSPTIRIGEPVARGLCGDRERGAEFGRGADQLLERQPGASFSETGASSPAAMRRSELAASASSIRSGATGRTRKSDAPARIASTATETLSPCEITMTGNSRAFRAGPRSISAPVLVPAASRAARTSRACGPSRTASARFLVRRAHDAPAGARGDGRDQPALVRIGVEQQKGAGWFFAHKVP